MSDCDQIDVLLEDLLGEKLVLPEPYFAEEEYDIAAMVADMRASGDWGEIFPDLFVPLPVCQLLRKSHKVKRGPAKGKTIKMSVHPCIAVLMMSCLKRRRGGGCQMLSAEELNRRQMQMHRDSYRMASAMNSGDLK